MTTVTTAVVALMVSVFVTSTGQEVTVMFVNALNNVYMASVIMASVNAKMAGQVSIVPSHHARNSAPNMVDAKRANVNAGSEASKLITTK